jgi:hypothetical protein
MFTSHAQIRTLRTHHRRLTGMATGMWFVMRRAIARRGAMLNRAGKSVDGTVTVPAPEPLDSHPHGHVLGHAPTDPVPHSLSGHPHGHVVGEAPTDPRPQSLKDHPRGHVVGEAASDPAPESLDDYPHGHVVGHRSSS